VVRGKEPATKRGFHDATLNPATISRWWKAQPYNIGIRTGAESGVWVFDVDGADGRASLAKLVETHGPLPVTPVSLTRNGFHFCFRYTGPIPSSVGKIGPGLDVRGDGGYIVAPPSIHPSGHVYQWTDDAPTGELAIAPERLVRLARARPQFDLVPPVVRHDGAPDAYGRAALEREVAALAAVPVGARNNSLNRTAFRLFQLVAGGELDREHVIAELVVACHRNGLVRNDGLRSVLATIQSGERAGMLFPRLRGAA
jgi:hypothetical protein